MQFTDEIIKKFELVKSDRNTGTSFMNDAKIYETKIFDGLDVCVMDCDMNGETKDVRDKNLLNFVIIRDKGRTFNILVSGQMFKHCGVDLINKIIQHNIEIHDNNRKEVG